MTLFFQKMTKQQTILIHNNNYNICQFHSKQKTFLNYLGVNFQMEFACSLAEFSKEIYCSKIASRLIGQDITVSSYFQGFIS